MREKIGKMSKWLKSLDSFGKPIGVNYQGSDTYQTTLGGLCSLGTFFFLLIYATVMTVAMIKKSNSSISSMTTATNLHLQTVDDAVDLGAD